MSTEYVRHDAIVALRKTSPNDEEPENQVIGCTGCGWRSSEESFSAAGFASHLAELGAPEYLVDYWDQWAGLVEVPFGALDRDAVARELADYSVVMNNVSIVYDQLSGFSKPNTAPKYVIAETERRLREHYALELCEQAMYRDKAGEPLIAGALRELAEQWLAGAWETFLEEQLRREHFANSFGG